MILVVILINNIQLIYRRGNEMQCRENGPFIKDNNWISYISVRLYL